MTKLERKQAMRVILPAELSSAAFTLHSELRANNLLPLDD